MVTKSIVKNNYQFRAMLGENRSQMALVLNYLAQVKRIKLAEPPAGPDGQLPNNSVDFLANGKKVQFISDTKIHTSGNFAIELIGQSEPPTLGWFLTSEADSLLYYDAVKKIGHIVSLPALRTGYTNYPKGKLSMSHVTTPAKGKRKGYFGDCALVPLSDIIHWPGIGYQTINLADYQPKVPKPAPALDATATAPAVLTPVGPMNTLNKSAAQVKDMAGNRVEVTMVVNGETVKQYAFAIDFPEALPPVK